MYGPGWYALENASFLSYFERPAFNSAAKSLSAARRGLRERAGGKSKDVLLRVQQLRSSASEVSIVKGWRMLLSRGSHGENTGWKEGNTPRVEKGFPPIYDRAGYVSNCKNSETKGRGQTKDWPPAFLSRQLAPLLLLVSLPTMYDCVPVDSYAERKGESVCTIRVAGLCCPHHRDYYNFSW